MPDMAGPPAWAREETPSGPPDDMAALLRSPPEPPMSCPKGSSLWLLGRKLDDACAGELAGSLTAGNWGHLTYLTIAINDISGRGVTGIAHALGKGAAPLLATLNVSQNPLGDEGAAALAGCLHAMPELSWLEMSECRLGDVGARALASAAKAGATPMLKLLSLRANAVGDEGIEAICEACASGGLPRLERLNLSETQIGDEGCLVLANAIEDGHMDHLRQIQLGRIRASRDGFEVVTDVLKEYEKRRPEVQF